MADQPPVNTRGKGPDAKSVAVLPSVNTGGERPDAKSVAVRPSVNTGGKRQDAESVADWPSVNTGGERSDAKSVTVLPSVNTGGKRQNAKDAAVLPSVNTGSERPNAKSVAGRPSVITGGLRPIPNSAADLPPAGCLSNWIYLPPFSTFGSTKVYAHIGRYNWSLYYVIYKTHTHIYIFIISCRRNVPLGPSRPAAEVGGANAPKPSFGHATAVLATLTLKVKPSHFKLPSCRKHSRKSAQKHRRALAWLRAPRLHPQNWISALWL